MPVSYYFDDHSFVVSFEIRSTSPQTLLSFFKTVLAIQDPLRFHMNLGVDFSISTKRLLEFDRDCIESIAHFE